MGNIKRFAYTVRVEVFLQGKIKVSPGKIQCVLPEKYAAVVSL